MIKISPSLLAADFANLQKEIEEVYKGGADMPVQGELRINGIKNGRQYVMTPDLMADGVAFYDGNSGLNPSELEANCFVNAILGKGELCVTAEQAACVTKILEGIYESEKTGKPYCFS